MKSFRHVARRLLRLAIPTLTVAVWFWAASPTIALGREDAPVYQGPIADGGGDEFPDYVDGVRIETAGQHAGATDPKSPEQVGSRFSSTDLYWFAFLANLLTSLGR